MGSMAIRVAGLICGVLGLLKFSEDMQNYTGIVFFRNEVLMNKLKFKTWPHNVTHCRDITRPKRDRSNIRMYIQ